MKYFCYITLLIGSLFCIDACTDTNFDELERINQDQAKRLEALNELSFTATTSVNNQIANIRAILDLEKNMHVVQVKDVKDEQDKSIIYFTDGSQIVINHAQTPIIAIDTASGMWLINNELTNIRALGLEGHKQIPPQIKAVDGFWWIKNEGDMQWQQSVRIKGDTGDDAIDPVIAIDPNGIWTLNGQQLRTANGSFYYALGDHAKAPKLTIKNNDDGTGTANWWIDNLDTKIKAIEQKGATGAVGVAGYDAPYIQQVSYVDGHYQFTFGDSNHPEAIKSLAIPYQAPFFLNLGASGEILETDPQVVLFREVSVNYTISKDVNLHIAYLPEGFVADILPSKIPGSGRIKISAQANATRGTILLEANDGVNSPLVRRLAVFSPKIGDVYRGGVVFWVNSTAGLPAIKTVHAESFTTSWIISGTKRVLIGATSLTDGKENGDKITAYFNTPDNAEEVTALNYPLFSLYHKPPMYIPAKDELFLLMNNIQTINAGIIKLSGNPLNNQNTYWSSTEFNSRYVWIYEKGQMVQTNHLNASNEVRLITAY